VNCGVVFEGDVIDMNKDNWIDEKNTVNGKPVIFWVNRSGGTISEQAGQIFVLDCNWVYVTGQVLDRCSMGIWVSDSRGITLRQNTIHNASWYGINIRASKEVRVEWNQLSINNVGIRMEDVIKSNLSYNSISGSSKNGIYGDKIGNTMFFRNWITGSGNGTYLRDSYEVDLMMNDMSHNQRYGVILSGPGMNVLLNRISYNGECGIGTGEGNRIYYNDIFGNRVQTTGDGGENRWDDGKGLGNYWGDYDERYPDAVKYGMVYGTPYVIDIENNAADNFPAVDPFGTPDRLGPKFSEDNSDTEAIAGEMFNFSVKIWDIFGVVEAYIYLYFDDIPSRLIPIMNSTDGYLNASYRIPYIPGLMGYRFYASNELGIHNMTMIRNFPILDLDPPTANASASHYEIMVGESILLDGSESSDQMGILNYTWILKNGDSRAQFEGERTIHVLEEAGVYEIELIVTDYGGNIDTDTIIVTVHPFEGGEMLSVRVGPVINEDNGTLENVLVEISFMDHSYNSTTDSDGFAVVDVPLGLVGRVLSLKLSLDGYRNATFESKVLENGTLEDAPPPMVSIPQLDDEEGSGGASSIKVVMAVLMVILILAGVFYALYPFVRKPGDIEE
jgi:parallel beta-helix repeat protein